jgi:hypothetical protein
MKAIACLPCVFLAIVGCDSSPPSAGQPLPSTPIPLADRYDPQTTATIHGRVTWSGDIPTVPPFEVWPIPLEENGPRSKRLEPNPNAPVIDPTTRGVANAVIFLRGVEPARSRPWDHAHVRVEQRDQQIHILQGADDSRIGFVRRGDTIDMVSRDPLFHALRAEGAAFFTLMFPDPDVPCSRRLTETGVVELSSAAGRYAMRAYLFVDDHPYYTRTDAQGRFGLDRVPPGRYDVVCWLPNWHAAQHERDPDTAIINRLLFHKPAKWTQPVVAKSGETAELHVQASQQSFPQR